MPTNYEVSRTVSLRIPSVLNAVLKREGYIVLTAEEATNGSDWIHTFTQNRIAVRATASEGGRTVFAIIDQRVAVERGLTQDSRIIDFVRDDLETMLYDAAP